MGWDFLDVWNIFEGSDEASQLFALHLPEGREAPSVHDPKCSLHGVNGGLWLHDQRITHVVLWIESRRTS